MRILAVLLVIGLLATGLPALAGAQVDEATLAPHDGRPVVAIDVEGNKVTREHVLRREIRTAVGRPLDVATVQADVVRLANLNIFASVTVVPEAAAPDGVRLRYVVREIPSWLPVLAVQYTEENGFSVGPGLSAQNLTGRDIALSAKAFFGGTTQYMAQLGWPWIGGGRYVSLDLTAARRERADALNEFHETSHELTPWVGRHLGERGRVAVAFSLFEMASDVDGKTLSPDNSDELRRLGLRLGWDSRDSWTNTRRGWQNELQLWSTGGLLGGDGDFRSLTLDLRRWQPLGGRHTLLLTGLLGLQSGEVGTDVPVYLQYRLGGANTIRGYDVEVLGKTLYGRDQLLGTAEYSFTLAPMRRLKVWKLEAPLGLDVAAFVDAGIAWSDSRDFALKRGRAGGGVGLRLINPFTSVVRLDLAWSPEGGLRFHFAAGLKPARQRDRLR